MSNAKSSSKITVKDNLEGELKNKRKRIDAFKPYRPIEKRFVVFECRPNEQQLGTDLGYGLMGASNRTLTDDDVGLKYVPQPIPVVFAAICVTVPFIILLVYVLYFNVQDRGAWAMLLFSIVIIPMMIVFLSWLNAMEGDEPFLVFDKSTAILELPRVGMSFPQEQLREVVFLERFVQGNLHWQVALLLEEKPVCWKYVHLFNESESAMEIQWLGVKDTYQKIADALNVESRRLRFNKKESKELAS